MKRARHLSADERKEVQGFIADIEGQITEDARAGNGATPATAAPPAIKPAPSATSPSTSAAVSAPTSAPAPPAPGYLAPPPAQTRNPGQRRSRRSRPPRRGTGSSRRRARRPGQIRPLAYNGGPPRSLAAPAPAPAPPHLVTRPPEATGGETHTSPLRIVGIVSVVAAGAAAAGGTFALLSARSTFDDAQKNGCPGANSKTYCDSKANAVDSANTLSKIFFVGAGLLGIAGITMIVAAPSPTPDGRVSLAVSGRSERPGRGSKQALVVMDDRSQDPIALSLRAQ